MSEFDKEMSQDAGPQRRALLLDPDLFFAVKVGAMLKHVGMETTTVRQLADWTGRLGGERFDIALVNTAARGVEWVKAIGVAHAADVPVIAYGSHIDVEAQAQARAAGATRVIANSKLAADLPSIVEQTLGRARAKGGREGADREPAAAPGRDTDDGEA